MEDPSQVVVTLTSDHGTSPSFDSPAEQQERFNVRQAEVITNAFIGAQHGNGEWILGYIDRAFYLNHNLIYEKGLSIADMQHDVATFLMQLRGVSHAVSAEALRSTYFGSGYGRKVQNGFYPGGRVMWWSISCPTGSRSATAYARCQGRCIVTTPMCLWSYSEAASRPRRSIRPST